jgi:hypothetical protein
MNDLLVACFGGGVNSAGMLIEMHRREIIPDITLFADTEGERPETYRFVTEFSGWLVQHHMPPITTVRVTGEALEENCLRREALPSVAYGFKTCSQRWKSEPQEKFLNHWAGGRFYRKAIGFDAGEPQRAKVYKDTKCEAWYPLVEWDLDRDDCDRLCRSEGFTVAKSSCFFCPNMRRREVLELSKEHPDLYARAVAMERSADLTAVQGLGRTWRWGDIHLQLPLFEIDKSMPCGCYDGD